MFEQENERMDRFETGQCLDVERVQVVLAKSVIKADTNGIKKVAVDDKRRTTIE